MDSTNKKNIENFVSRDHFGIYLGSGTKNSFFKYQNIIYKLEAKILKYFGITINKISTFDEFFISKKYFVLSNTLLRLHKLKKIPFINANIVNSDNSYIKFENHNYHIIKMRYDSRPSIVIIPGFIISSNIIVKKNSILKYGITILENVDPIALEGCLKVIIIIKNNKINDQYTYKIPLNKKNIFSESFYEIGKNWIDSYLDLKKYSGEKIYLNMIAKFEHDIKNQNLAATPCIAWSTPQIVKKKNSNNCKRIVVICCEALTDPRFLLKNYNVQINTPNLNRISNENYVSSRSYSQSDSTLASTGSVLTGLYGSQHGILDYQSDPFLFENPTLSSHIKTFLWNLGYLTFP